MRHLASTLFSVALAGMLGRALGIHLGKLKKQSRDLVLMHVPYNFGHTVEMVALLPRIMLPHITEGSNGSSALSTSPEFKVTWGEVKAIQLFKPRGEVWGHFNPDLNRISEVTKCPMYYTPQKYWPKDLAAKYFGNRTVFGMLRDPYERLVAFFRGGFADYGGDYPEFRATCDVSGAVKKMMRDSINGSNTFRAGCTFVPQAEYFEGEHGITLPIDNRRFPDSMNEAFAAHGYAEHIEPENIAHVRGCDHIWAGDLDAKAKRLVRHVYARDFKLLCKHFGYCDSEESVCITGVPYMCPTSLFTWDAEKKHYERTA